MSGNGDYISREAANEACREAVRRYPNSFYNGIEAARDAICHLPAADVRPVVLCRDCLHYEMGACLKIYDDGAANKDAWQERKPDDYCSYGEDKNAPTNCRTNM